MFDKKTKVICTIGPASDKKEIIDQLIEKGMNVARLNFSHGDHASHQAKIDLLKEEIAEGKNIAIMLDTKGPEVRVGKVENDNIDVKEGDLLRISMTPVLGSKDKISVSYPNLYDDIDVGTVIRIDDGKLGLTVIDKDSANRELVCRISNNFTLKSNKSIGVPFKTLNMKFVSEKDKEDLKFACKNKIDFIAASFTRTKQDILDLKKVLEQNDGGEIKVIAKIENHDGFKNIDEILDVADGIMVARGDLGVEVSFEEVPVIQKVLIKKAREKGKIIIIATHMLESMQFNPTPTRAEVSDVANAVYEAVDAVMLSGETASGQFPVESCEMESRIARRVEKELPYRQLTENAYKYFLKENSDSIAYSVASTALMINAKLIVCFSATGNTARRISFYRPECPIVMISDDQQIRRSVALNFGVYGVVIENYDINVQAFEKIARQQALKAGLKHGDTLLMSGGELIGNTNFMKIVTL